MNTQVQMAAAAAPKFSQAVRPFYWSLRREFWEHRSLYIAPLVVAVTALAGFLVATIGRALSISDLARRREILTEPYSFVALVIMGTAFLVSVLYCLDALYGERRERSILFWKSLPVSDFAAVLTKAAVPILVVPLLSFAITVITQFIMLVLSSFVVLGSGMDAGAFWAEARFVEHSLSLLYHLVAIHGLWYAPVYAWLLLVSAWATRAPLVWAVLPLIGIGLLERLAFGSMHFKRLLGERMSGGREGELFMTESAHPLAHLSPGDFLLSPGLWIGFAVAAAFLAGAMRLRRTRDPM